MSGIEERLARDIAAITGGVVVTESDLLEAGNAMEERRNSKGRRDRLLAVGGVAAAAVVVAAVGVSVFQTLSDGNGSVTPANSGPTAPVDIDADYLTGKAPTPELIEGVWRVDNNITLMLFTQDGTVQFDRGGTLFSSPDTSGSFMIDGDTIAVSITDSAQAECVGEDFTVRASLPKFGAMRFVPASSSSEDCSPLPVWKVALEQVLPTNSKFLAALNFSGPGQEGWKPPLDEAAIYGDWMAEVTDSMQADNGSGGFVLEISPNGSYTVAAKADVVDRGRWIWDQSAAQLSLVSDGYSTVSSSCDPGDRLVLGGVQQLTQDATGMRASAVQNDCGGAWADATWILLPHEGR